MAPVLPLAAATERSSSIPAATAQFPSLVMSTPIEPQPERQRLGPEPWRSVAGAQVAAVEFEAVGRGAARARVLVEKWRCAFVRCGSRGEAEAVAR